MPFERQLRGEEDKPLPPSKPRKQYKRSPENRGSKPESKKKRKMEREECEVSGKKCTWIKESLCQMYCTVTVEQKSYEK